jgi:peptidoglycan hydrolase-like protein with peptidoglycan-binding domain
MGTSGSSSSGTQADMNQNGQQASQSEIQQAQQQLKSKGLYHGAVDGVMGPETQTALMAFQRQHSLPQTSQLDQQTLDALNAGGSNAGSGMTGGSTSGTHGGAAGMGSGPAGTTNPATNGGGYSR